jgi:hypothetical protein
MHLYVAVSDNDWFALHAAKTPSRPLSFKPKHG